MLLIILLLLLLFTSQCNSKTIPIFPTILVFGDSSVDTGNNNYIITPFRGDHPPYGIDFPGRVPTGRFSNGKLVPDILAALMGLKESVPPFLKPNLSDTDIVTGVSFASAGSGYDELTTSVSHVIPVSSQMGFFRDYIRRLEGIVGGEEAASGILARALVIVSAGTNDFIFNFYDTPTRRVQFGIHEYQDFLQNKLQKLVKVKGFISLFMFFIIIIIIILIFFRHMGYVDLTKTANGRHQIFFRSFCNHIPGFYTTIYHTIRKYNTKMI
ncbi:hypothetical protein OROMI_015780 [Orobanche minor]